MIKDMHYDFNMKLNKLDSQQYRDILIPEKDWVLNEAQNLFVKMVAQPRYKTRLGLETSQRNIDDIRTVIKTETIDVVDGVVSLPTDYGFYVKGEVFISKGQCKSKKAKVFIQQHDDDFENSPHHSSSFEWRVVNGVFNNKGLEFSSPDFICERVKLTYIKKLNYIHNAEDFMSGGYTTPSGTHLTGFVNCELPESTHKEIVDIAVLLVTGQLQIPDIQVKQNKLGFNNLLN